MKRAYDITVDSTSLRIASGAHGDVAFTVTNKTGETQPTRVRAVPSGGLARECLHGIDDRAVTVIAPDATQAFRVTVEVPADARPGTGRSFRLDAYSNDAPDTIYTEGPRVELDVVGAAAIVEQRKKSRAWLWWAIAAVVLVGAGVGVWRALDRRTVLIEDLVMQDVDDAADWLERHELDVGEIKHVGAMRGARAGIVLLTKPAAGETVEVGTPVALDIAMAIVPQLEGLTPAQAAQALEGVHLEMKLLDRVVADPVKFGKVVDQMPIGLTECRILTEIEVSIGKARDKPGFVFDPNVTFTPVRNTALSKKIGRPRR